MEDLREKIEKKFEDIKVFCIICGVVLLGTIVAALVAKAIFGTSLSVIVALAAGGWVLYKICSDIF